MLPKSSVKSFTAWHILSTILAFLYLKGGQWEKECGNCESLGKISGFSHHLLYSCRCTIHFLGLDDSVLFFIHGPLQLQITNRVIVIRYRGKVLNVQLIFSFFITIGSLQQRRYISKSSISQSGQPWNWVNGANLIMLFCLQREGQRWTHTNYPRVFYRPNCFISIWGVIINALSEHLLNCNEIDIAHTCTFSSILVYRSKKSYWYASFGIST